MQPLVLCLTRWSRAVGINNNPDGFLSSYTMMLLCIFYLVRVGVLTPLAPTTANLPPIPEYPDSEYWEDTELCATRLGQLAVGFFGFFAVDFPSQLSVVSLRCPGELTKADKVLWSASSSDIRRGQEVAREVKVNVKANVKVEVEVEVEIEVEVEVEVDIEVEVEVEV